MADLLSETFLFAVFFLLFIPGLDDPAALFVPPAGAAERTPARAAVAFFPVEALLRLPAAVPAIIICRSISRL